MSESADPFEQDYRQAVRSLRRAFRKARKFLACSGDWATRLRIEEGYRALLGELGEFTRCQYGVTFPRQVREKRFE
jgi:hypothetical protein